MSEIVQSERHGAVALLRLNRPEALNALSDDVLEALCRALDATEESADMRCVVLCGAGRAFAAGADVAGLRELSADDVLTGERGARWARLRASRLPVVAAVQGWCLGGGCELALTCDIVLAAEDARFGLPETGLGLIPGAGGTQWLPRIAGRSLALEVILAGRTLTAREALRAGICSRVVASEALEREALALATRIAARPVHAVRLAREAVALAFETPIGAGLAQERRLFARAFASDDAREGMDAFVERRAPVWSHGS
jgi:enoyl-CoA hydratase/carnithine racemase